MADTRSPWAGPAHRLVPGDLAAAAKAVGVPEPALVAVLAVEARGSGFDGQGRPIILFEPHVMFRQTRAFRPADLARAEKAGVAYARWRTRPYPKGQQGQYDRLAIACAIDPECAFRSISIGIAQILGENYAQAGYSSAVQMFEAFKISEQDQLAAMLRLIRKWGLIPAMQRGDWAAFARKYNGPGAVARYSGLLSAAHKRAGGIGRIPPAAPGFVPPLPPASPVAPATPRAEAPARRGRVRIYAADALNDAELRRVRRTASETDDLNARELARIRGDA